VYHFIKAMHIFLVLVACLRKTLLHSMNYSTAQQNCFNNTKTFFFCDFSFELNLWWRYHITL